MGARPAADVSLWPTLYEWRMLLQSFEQSFIHGTLLLVMTLAARPIIALVNVVEHVHNTMGYKYMNGIFMARRQSMQRMRTKICVSYILRSDTLDDIICASTSMIRGPVCGVDILYSEYYTNFIGLLIMIKQQNSKKKGC